MEERNLRLTREKADLASSLTELEEELAEVRLVTSCQMF